MGTQTLPRYNGAVLDPERVRYQLALKGLSQRDLGRISGIGEAQVSRALHGKAIEPATLRRIVAALLEAPDLPGAELVVSEPESRTAAASHPQRSQEVSRGSGPIER